MGVRVLTSPPMTFIHLKKTGGSSVQDWLLDNLPKESRQRFSKHGDLQYAQKEFNNLGFTFSIIRNPFAREVSWYFYMIQKAKKRLEKIKPKLIKNTTLSEKLKQEHNYCNHVVNVLEPLGFKNYVMNRPHLLPQYKQIKGIDCVIKLENLEEEFKIIQDRLQIYTPLLHKNKSNHKNYLSYYDEELRDFVYKKHKDDFDAYNYSFD
jgi:hypothetical protein